MFTKRSASIGRVATGHRGAAGRLNLMKSNDLSEGWEQPSAPVRRSRCPGVSRTGVLPLLCILLSGCSLLPEQQRELITPAYRPENVFTWTSTLPINVKWVAVLPLVCDSQNIELTSAKGIFEPILLRELAKTKKFQITSVNPEFLRARTGRTSCSDDEPLPPGLFGFLREHSGCDAVLFCRLTVFRQFSPLAVGWRMRLVDARTQLTLWSVDEVVDAGRPAVRAGARHFLTAELRDPNSVPDEWLMANSPRQFGEYAIAQLLATLPRR